MNPLAMIDECRIGFKGRAALGTKETLDILMDGDLVNTKSRSASETLRARWTCVRPFSYNTSYTFYYEPAWVLVTAAVTPVVVVMKLDN